MIRQSIRRKILAITLVLIVLMGLASIISLLLVRKVDQHFDRITGDYLPAYGHLAQANIRSLERAVYLRRMVIEKSSPGMDVQYDSLKQAFVERGKTVEAEIAETRAHVQAMIASRKGFDDADALASIDKRLDDWLNGERPALNRAQTNLLEGLEQKRARFDSQKMLEIDAIRDKLNKKIDVVRNDLLELININTQQTMQAQKWVSHISLAITVIAGLIGLFFALLVGNGIVASIRQLLEGARAVQAGNLDYTISVFSNDEIGHLSQAFNQMVEELRFKERIRTTFGTYVDPRVVNGLLSAPSVAPQGQRQNMTVLFCDLGGFSHISEKLAPQALVRLVNRYFTIMSAPIREHNGVIDKYIGDAIMAYWGPPYNDENDQAHLAVRAALDMTSRIGELNLALRDDPGLSDVGISFDIRIGIASGDVIVGSIGSEEMKNFTVIGDTVNTAARLESICKVYGVRMMIAGTTALAAADDGEMREIDCVCFAGQNVPHPIYEIMGAKGAIPDNRLRLRELYHDALGAYRARDWSRASGLLTEALALAPEDGPCGVLLDRMVRFRDKPPAQDWDGVWRFDQK